MLKPIFEKDVDFFSKKIILCAKGGYFKKGALDSDFMFVNIEPYKSRNVSHIKLSKYCDIDISQYCDPSCSQIDLNL